jgi:protein-disulfide isomerase
MKLTASILFVLISLCVGMGCEGGSGENVATGDSMASPVQRPSPTQGTREDVDGPTRVPEEQEAQQPLQISQMGYNSGSADAPVKVLEISDFGCGYCRRFHEETFPALTRIYIDPGLVEWKFLPFVLGRFPNGLQAALAAECAGEQDVFFPMQSRLFSDQGAWRNRDEPFEYFYQLAQEEELDVLRFELCLSNGWRENRVRANNRLGFQAGAQGTPYFLVDGRPIPGALPLDDFRQVLDAALARRGIEPPRH